MSGGAGATGRSATTRFGAGALLGLAVGITFVGGAGLSTVVAIAGVR